MICKGRKDNLKLLLTLNSLIMKNSENEIVVEKILAQFKGYLYELNSRKSSSASDYVSTEAYNGVEWHVE